jgi:hypothetical protein
MLQVAGCRLQVLEARLVLSDGQEAEPDNDPAAKI